MVSLKISGLALLVEAVFRRSSKGSSTYLPSNAQCCHSKSHFRDKSHWAQQSVKQAGRRKFMACVIMSSWEDGKRESEKMLRNVLTGNVY